MSTLDIIRTHRDRFTVVGLSAHGNESGLLHASEEFDTSRLALSGAPPRSQAVHYHGPEGLRTCIEETDADIVVNGIAGSEGLLPSIAALQSGKDLALANKETIVMAGNLVGELAKKMNRNILPVDSEHSALFFLFKGFDALSIKEIILTASGGAFRDMETEQLHRVTFRDALNHPTWNMGKKITIDSATLANKGLEVIEAHILFAMPTESISVVIHPQSSIHSLVRTAEGSLYAQISEPDMRIPIQNALTYPDVIDSSFASLELGSGFAEGFKRCSELTFLSVDEKKYPMLPLAFSAARSGGAAPIVYNAANEIAVNAFIGEQIGYFDIPAVVESTLERNWENLITSFKQILEIDKRARTETAAEIQKIVQGVT